MALFIDRRDAGVKLASKLSRFREDRNVAVLALPRGGVPVAFEVARALNAPLGVFLVRKLGAPTQPELAIGAVASGGVEVLNSDVIARLGLSPTDVEKIVRPARRELQLRESAYRVDSPPVVIRGNSVILVDDGLATGATIRAAARAVRLQSPRSITIAAPVAPASVFEDLALEADHIVILATPLDFEAVGFYYEDFSQTSDADVRALLAVWGTVED